MTTALVEDVDAIAPFASPASLACYLPNGHAGLKFKRRPHLDLISDLLVDATFGRLPEGNGRYLLINIMAQVGKSTLCSQWFSVWVNELIAQGILDPGPVALLTYESTLGRKWGRQTREAIVQNPGLLSCRVSPASSAMDEWETTVGGGMIARGISGAFTGRPARYFVGDDLNKVEDIQSKLHRDDVWMKWLSVGEYRIHPEAPVIIIQARAHEDDFSGRLLSNDYEGDPKDWMLVRIPGLAETDEERKDEADRRSEPVRPDPLARAPGEPLYRPDVAIDRDAAVEFIEQKKSSPYLFSAQVQQRPTPAGGRLFKRSMFRSWQYRGERSDRSGIYLLDKPDAEEPRRVLMKSCLRFAIIDLAASLKQEADFLVAGLFDLTPHWDLLLIDLVRDKLEAPDQIALFSELNKKWRPSFIGIEQAGFQLTAVQHAQRRGIPVKGVKAEGDKWTRALNPQARMTENSVYFPLDAPWLEAFTTELLEFPGGVHDDQVDVLSYAAIAASELARTTGWSKN